MITLRHVLVATDFSEPSEDALRYGRAFAESFGGALHVLHVVPDAMALPWAAVTDGPSLADVQQQWEQEAETRLRQLLPEGAAVDAHVHLVVRAGDPVRQIVGYAREQGVDLVVLGTHGRGLVAHMLLGSVAERVVRLAPCPVLTVRHPQHGFVTEALVAAERHDEGSAPRPAAPVAG